MPTSDGRREVAARLRLCARETNGTSDFAMYLNHWVGVGNANVGGQFSVKSDRKTAEMTLETLADLIDPTCEMVVKNGHACCGRCGHKLADECEVEEDYYEFRPFCPDCGARVTNGGES